MSTKSTIKYGQRWSLYEDMIDDTVYVETKRATWVRFEMPPDLIDAIRQAPDSAFPHLRKKGGEG